MTPMEQSERKGLVERLRNGFDWHDEVSVGQAERDMDAAADLLSSDARPAPMAEEVKEALAALRIGASVSWDNAGAAANTLSAHIDDLTRKVAEAEGLLREVDDGGLDNEPAIRKLYANADWVRRRNAFLAGQPLSRPSPGPATETERKDDDGGKALLIDERIVIQIPISTLPIAFAASPRTPLNDDAEPTYRVADVSEFAKSVCAQLNKESETGTTLVHRMFDEAMEEALDQGDEGLEEIDSALLASVRPKTEGA